MLSLSDRFVDLFNPNDIKSSKSDKCPIYLTLPFFFQLCLAIADLALQMTTWKSPVIYLINQSRPTNIWTLLELLTVLPEEVNSRSLRLGSNRRQQVLDDFSQSSSAVTQFLVSSFNFSEGFQDGFYVYHQ